VFLSCAGVMKIDAGVPVYHSTQEKDREACISLISLGETKYKFPNTKRSVACSRGQRDYGDCDLLVPGASEGTRLITPAGYAAGHLRLSRVVVFVVFASRSPCMM
jgi:hypothetical protein